MDKTDWLIIVIVIVLVVMCTIGFPAAMTKRESKTTIEKDLEFTTKIFECMYYCRENYGLEGCKNACFYVRENAKGGE